MAESTTVPGVGKVPKKELTIGLVVVGTLVVVYFYRKNQATPAATAASSATTTDQYPPDGTVGNPQDLYSTDPATGQTYGDEAAGSGGTYGAYGTGAASGLYYDPSTGAYDLTSPYGTSTTSTPTGTVAGGPPFSTNAQWSNWVIAQMVANNPQQDPGALTDALGLYLEGQPVDASQQQLIFDAIAIGNDPPVAGANGYPPNVRLNGNKGPTGGGTPLPSQVEIPIVTGIPLAAAAAYIENAGLVPASATSWQAGYNSVGGQATVKSQVPAGGTMAAKGSTVTLNT